MKGILDFQPGDKAEYISDYVGYSNSDKEKRFKFARVDIPGSMARGLLEGARDESLWSFDSRYGSIMQSFTNKAFLCLAVTDYGTRLFLYKHDFDWYLYTVTPEIAS